MAQAMQNAADQLEQGNANQAMEGMQQAAGEMNQLEQMLREMAALNNMDTGLNQAMSEMMQQSQAAQQQQGNGTCSSCGEKLSECKGEGQCQGSGQAQAQGQAQSQSAGNGEWTQGDSQKPGSGSGGAGQGKGGERPMSDTQVGFRKVRIKGDVQPGRILARIKVPAKDNPPGEITTQYENLRIEYQQQAEETIAHETIPLEHKSIVRDYYDAIKLNETSAQN
jgi:hypothetical protein